MAVKLRLTRMGSKGRPMYRIVAADSRTKRDGKIIEQVGFCNPIANPAEIKIDAELANKWLDNGAQPTDTVRALFKQAGVLKARHEAKNTTKKSGK